MSYIQILKPGLFSSIQDYGRPDGGAYGIPWGGVMDRHSFELCNQILGNPIHTPVIEITQIGPTIKFNCNTNIALTGADLSAMINGVNIKMNAIQKVVDGDIIHFGKPKSGYRCYLGFSKTMDLKIDENSYSTYSYAKLGGLNGDCLKQNDIIKLKNRSYKHNYRKLHRSLTISTPLIVNVSKGPEYHLLSNSQRKQLLSTLYSIDKDSNRMGIRLSSKKAIKGLLGQIVSSGIVRGTVQLPPSGKPIILMSEAPTTGGYLRVFNCDEYCINQIAQLQPNDNVVFQLNTKEH